MRASCPGLWVPSVLPQKFVSNFWDEQATRFYNLCPNPTEIRHIEFWNWDTEEDSRMAMDAAEIERLIKESIPDARVNIEDLRGDGDHYAATVISAAFAGKTRVQQHQMVYQALRGRMGEQLHALALQTSAPPSS